MKRKKKYSIEEVKEIFEKENCELLSKSYVNNSDKLNYICSCGNTSSINLKSFLKGSRCKQCGYEKVKNFHLHSIEEVKEIFEKENCELLSNEYIDYQKKLKYICSCGEVGFTKLDKFKIGQRCGNCRVDRLLATKKENGLISLVSHLTEYEEYRRRITNISNRNYTKYKKIINPYNKERKRNKYSLDHRFSVVDGFLNKIDENIISHPCNLQIITEKENMQKHSKSDITIEVLEEKIKFFEEEDV